MQLQDYDQALLEIEAIASPEGQGFTLNIETPTRTWRDVAIWARQDGVLRIDTTDPQGKIKPYWIDIATIQAISICDD